MNVLALCLVYASLATAGFWNPSPEKHNSKDDVTVKGVVIGFEENDGNTRVSISPQDLNEKGYVENAKEKLEEAKERFKEASSSVLPEVMKKGDSERQEEEIHHRFMPGEVVCDAHGKCKDKIESYMGRTKEATQNKANEVEEGAKEAAREAIGRAKDTVTHLGHATSDKAHETKESVKDKIAETASEMKEGVEEKVSEKAKEAEELAKRATERAKRDAHRAKQEGKKGLKGILAHMVSPMRRPSFTGVLHLLGFAVAYGMSVWVTFASNYVLAGALPRHQLAMVQSKIYPAYFKAMAYSVAMALLGHMMGQRKRFSSFGMGMFRGFDLIASLVMILVNLLYLEPRTTKVTLERMKKEKEEGAAVGSMTETAAARGTTGEVVDSTTETAAARGGETTTQAEEKLEKADAAAKPQNMRSSGDLLHRLNRYSSMLNVATLMFLSWHIVHLGQHLHAVC